MKAITAIVCAAGLCTSAFATPPELVDLGPGYGSISGIGLGYNISMPLAGLTRGVYVAKANKSAVAWGHVNSSTINVNKYTFSTNSTSTISSSDFSAGVPFLGALSTDGSTVYGFTYDVSTAVKEAFEWNPALSPAISITTNQWSGGYPLWYATATGEDSNGKVALFYSGFDGEQTPSLVNVLRTGGGTPSWTNLGDNDYPSGPAYFAMTATGSMLTGLKSGSDERRPAQRSRSSVYAVVKRSTLPELVYFGTTNARTPSVGFGINAEGTLSVGHTLLDTPVESPCTGAYGNLGFLASIPSSGSINAQLLSPLSLFPGKDCSWVPFGYPDGPATRAFDIGGGRAVGHVSPARFPLEDQNEHGFVPNVLWNAVVWTTSLYPYNLQQWADARLLAAEVAEEEYNQGRAPSQQVHNITKRFFLDQALSISHDGQMIAGVGRIQTREWSGEAYSSWSTPSGDHAWVIDLGECPLFKSCPGDLNLDGIVDDADFTLFGIAYENITCGPCCLADTNFDSMVDDADFSDFAVSYGALLCEDHPNIHRIDSIPDNP